MKDRIQKNLTKHQIITMEGSIDTELFLGKNTKEGIFLIPPDPSWGGNMFSPIINNLFNDCIEKNITVMRFSFLPFNNFTNPFESYLAQASVCLEFFFLETLAKNLLEDIWLVGYSLGAILSLNLALRRPEIDNLVMISPPFNMYESTSWLYPDKKNIYLFVGSKDEIIHKDILNEYIELLELKKMQVNLKYINNANHTFQNKEKLLSYEIIQKIVSNQTTN